VEVRGLRVKEGRSYGRIERDAFSTRKHVLSNVALDEALPVHRLFESLGRLQVMASGRYRRVQYVVEEGLGYGVEALTRYNREDDVFEVVLDPTTYDAIERGDEGRSIFTVPHEVGHLVLHPEECFELATIPHHRAMLRAQHKIFFDSEWQANVFAAALTMPAGGLAILESRGLLSPEIVRATYKVSAQAAAIRVAVYLQRKAELLPSYRR
jgi:hypothetical protein